MYFAVEEAKKAGNLLVELRRKWEGSKKLFNQRSFGCHLQFATGHNIMMGQWRLKLDESGPAAMLFYRV